MQYWRLATLVLLLFAVAFAKKKNPDDKTQVLALPVDPPMVATAETSRLVFHVSPLSAKGLLSQQTRDALHAILKINGGVAVVHLRAFVAGSGDLRRVPQIVSEVFQEKKFSLPSVSVVQVGALPMEGAQVVIEAVSEAKKSVNPDGLSFVSAPSLEQINAALHGAAPLLVTCFMNAVESKPGVNMVQMQREPSRSGAHCEAVGRGGDIKEQRLTFTGTQVAFGSDEKAAKLAFQRLDKELGGAKIIATNIYAISSRTGEAAAKLRQGQITMIPVEGVASGDGTFAVDVIATPRSAP
jgi:hypothetical protein